MAPIMYRQHPCIIHKIPARVKTSLHTGPAQLNIDT